MTSSTNWAIFIAIEASLTQALLPERHELGSRTGHMQLEPIIRRYGAYVFTIRIFLFIRDKWVLLNRSSPILASLSRSCRLLRILLYDGGILDSLKGPVSDRSNGFLTCGRLYLFYLFLTKTLFYGIPGVNPRRACPAGRLFNITRAELQISSFSFSCKNGYSAALFFPEDTNLTDGMECIHHRYGFDTNSLSFFRLLWD